MNNIMMKNKSLNFFSSFVDLSDYSLKASEFLNSILQEFDKDKIEEKVEEMHFIEHSADLKKHEIINTMVKEFLPPIDREDITDLSDKIDDVIDAIEDVLIYTYIFNVQAVRPEVLTFTKLIVRCCKSMKSALLEFENFRKSKNLNLLINEISSLEQEGDQLYLNGVRHIHESTKDPVELMVWAEIYHRLEECCDNCKRVVSTVENIVMKNV